MGQIILTYDSPKDTVTVIMMLYKNMKAMVYSSNGYTDFFDLVPGDMQRDLLVPYLFIIC